MGFSTFKQGADSYYEFICDSVDDIASLPTDCAPGSVAFVIEGSVCYMLNNQKTWKSI